MSERHPGHQSTPDAGGKPDGPLQAIHTLIARVKEGHPSHAESLQILEETLADWKGTSYRRLDLHKLRKVVEVIKQWHVHVDFDEDALAEDGSRFAQLLLAYNKAYFGDIRYAAGPGTGSGLRAVARVTSDGFIDRNGNVWRFPGLSVEVTKEPGTTAGSRVQPSRFKTDRRRSDSGVSRSLFRCGLPGAGRRRRHRTAHSVEGCRPPLPRV